SAHERIRQLPRVLSLLPRRAQPAPVPALAFHRQLAGAADPAAGDRQQSLGLAVAVAGGRLRLRVDRPLRLREEPPGHLPPPAVQPAGRLGDVRADAAREGQFLAALWSIPSRLQPRYVLQRYCWWQLWQVSPTGFSAAASAAQVAGADTVACCRRVCSWFASSVKPLSAMPKVGRMSVAVDCRRNRWCWIVAASHFCAFIACFSSPMW